MSSLGSIYSLIILLSFLIIGSCSTKQSKVNTKSPISDARYSILFLQVFANITKPIWYG